MKLSYVSVNNSGFNDFNDTMGYDLYEVFKASETKQYLKYQIIAHIFGPIMFLSNVTVVISSGLFLKEDNARKSTYLLLGNMSLADTIIGVFLILGFIIENPMCNHPICVFQMGLVVGSAMVSIFTVGLIAVDRYIYILHGLYYQKWFTTTRVRIGILCTWVVGITLSFLPATGWVNAELQHSRCYYVTLFPGTLILVNSFLSMVPIILVAVLYSIILIRALKNVKEIKETIKSASFNSKDNELRIHIGGDAHLRKNSQTVQKDIKIHRTASFDETYTCNRVQPITVNSRRSKSVEIFNEEISFSNRSIENQNNRSSCDTEFSAQESRNSTSRSQEINSSIEMDHTKPNSTRERRKNISKIREPNKWRAIMVVMLTTGGFIFTWMPFFITVIFFVFCQEQLTNPKCLHLRMLLNGPVAAMAFLNSILNPLIYAWWHKDFQRNIRKYFRRFMLRFFS